MIVHTVLVSLNTSHTYVSSFLQLEAGIEKPVLIFTEKRYPSFPYTCNFLSQHEQASWLRFTCTLSRVQPCWRLVIHIVLQPFWEAPARKEEKVKIKIPPLISEPRLLPQAAIADLLGLNEILLLP